jgi:hypothetical protein
MGGGDNPSTPLSPGFRRGSKVIHTPSPAVDIDLGLIEGIRG